MIAYEGEERIKKILEVKQHVNTGIWLTIFD